MSDLTSSTHSESVYFLNNSYIKEIWFLWRDLILIPIFLSTFCANVSLFLFSYSLVFLLSWLLVYLRSKMSLQIKPSSSLSLPPSFKFFIFKIFIGRRTTEFRLRGSRKQLEFRAAGFRECILSRILFSSSWTGAFTIKYKLSKSILYQVAFSLIEIFQHSDHATAF